MGQWAIGDLQIQIVKANPQGDDGPAIKAALELDGDIDRLVRIRFKAWSSVTGFGGSAKLRTLKKGGHAALHTSLKVLFHPIEPFNLTFWIRVNRSHLELYEGC